MSKRLVNALSSAAVMTCGTVYGWGCTTNDTGSIDLAAASAMAAPKPPMMPTTPMMMMMMPGMTCTADLDCPKPTPRCDVVLGKCVECTTDDDCADPMRHVCDVASAHCVGCVVDAGCGPGQRCEMDSLCHPTP